MRLIGFLRNSESKLNLYFVLKGCHCMSNCNSQRSNTKKLKYKEITSQSAFRVKTLIIKRTDDIFFGKEFAEIKSNWKKCRI